MMTLSQFYGQSSPRVFRYVSGEIRADGAFVVAENSPFILNFHDKHGRLKGWGLVDLDEWAGRVFEKPVKLKKPKGNRKRFNFGCNSADNC